MKCSARNRAFAVSTITIIFLVDIFTPSGIAIGLLYLLSLSFVSNESRRTIISFALTCVILTIADFILSYYNFYGQFSPVKLSQGELMYLERFLTCSGILNYTLIVLRYRKIREETEMKKQALIKSLEDMLYMMSHKVRHSVTQITGLMQVLNSNDLTQEQLSAFLELMKQPALSLDEFTREITSFIAEIKQKEISDT
jgi:signal transduction histidine kinase